MVRNKKAQISFEYLTIISFGLLILVSGIYVFNSYSVNTNDDFIVSRVEEVGYKIIQDCENLYYSSGQESIYHISVNFPTDVDDVYLIYNGEDTELIIDYTLHRGQSQAVFFTSVFLNASEHSDITDAKTFFIDKKAHSGATNIKLSNSNGGVQLEEVI